MNILSLFDGYSCGHQALERAGIPITNYYSSEIDTHAIKASKALFTNQIRLGDVRKVKASILLNIDVIIGGSPCQSFSFAGKRKGMSTKDEQEILTLEHYLQLKAQEYEFEGQSYLFWEFVRLLHELKPRYFLLENVVMGEKWERVLSKVLGINPIKINSALVSGQNRNRLYWTNIGAVQSGFFGDLVCAIEQPKDKGILLRDVLESKVDEKYFLSEKAISGFIQHTQKHKELGNGFNFSPSDGNSKGKCVTTKPGTRCDDNYIVAMRGRGEHNEQQLEARKDGKTNALTTVQKDNLLVVQLNPSKESGGTQPYQTNRVYADYGKAPCLDTDKRKNVLTNSSIRRLTPRECFRLQTVSEAHIDTLLNAGISDSQLYKMCGNGWTIDVIAHILQYLPNSHTQTR